MKLRQRPSSNAQLSKIPTTTAAVEMENENNSSSIHSHPAYSEKCNCRMTDCPIYVEITNSFTHPKKLIQWQNQNGGSQNNPLASNFGTDIMTINDNSNFKNLLIHSKEPLELSPQFDLSTSILKPISSHNEKNNSNPPDSKEEDSFGILKDPSFEIDMGISASPIKIRTPKRTAKIRIASDSSEGEDSPLLSKKTEAQISKSPLTSPISQKTKVDKVHNLQALVGEDERKQKEKRRKGLFCIDIDCNSSEENQEIRNNRITITEPTIRNQQLKIIDQMRQSNGSSNICQQESDIESDEVDTKLILNSRMRTRNIPSRFRSLLENGKNHTQAQVFDEESDEITEESEDELEEESDEDLGFIDDTQANDDDTHLPDEFVMTKDILFYFEKFFRFLGFLHIQPNLAYTGTSSLVSDLESLRDAMRRVVEPLQDLKSSAVVSDVWSDDFKKEMETYPIIDRTFNNNGSHCDVCRRPDRYASCSISFGGIPYDCKNLQPLPSTDSDSEDEEYDDIRQKDPGLFGESYSAGRYCARRVLLYHELHHFAHAMYVEVASFMNSYCRNRNIEEAAMIMESPPWDELVQRCYFHYEDVKRKVTAGYMNGPEIY